MRLLLVTTLTLLLINETTMAQSQCAFSGIATDQATGQPLLKARVFASRNRAKPALWTSTDERGFFCIREAEPGPYSLTVQHTGYLPQLLVDRRQRAPGASFSLAAGASFNNLSVSLVRAAVMEGKVVDENGDPVPAATVIPYNRWPPTTWSSSNDPARITTDAKGTFRFFDMREGTYHFLATTGARDNFLLLDRSNSATSALMDTYFPASLSIEGAAGIDLKPGEQVSGLTITMRKTALRSVSGRVIGAEPRTTVMLDTRFASGAGIGINVQLNPDGSFRRGSLMPGIYSVRVMGSAGFESTSVDLTQADAEGVVLGPSLTPPHQNKLELR